MTKPHHIFNLDEKACRMKLHKQHKIVAKKGTKTVHLMSQEHGENVTIVAYVSARRVPEPAMSLPAKRKKIQSDIPG